MKFSVRMRLYSYTRMVIKKFFWPEDEMFKKV